MSKQEKITTIPAPNKLPICHNPHLRHQTQTILLKNKRTTTTTITITIIIKFVAASSSSKEERMDNNNSHSKVNKRTIKKDNCIRETAITQRLLMFPKLN